MGKKLKVFEAFAGYGSQAMALRNLNVNYEVVAISEIDKYAIRAYEAIHGETNNVGDISKVAIEDVPDHDLFTYSFPCTDISLAGAQLGLKEGSGTRSSLLWECKKIIEGKKPKFLLMENVKNLIGKKHKDDFEKWINYLYEQGYKSYWKVLNSKDFGIPQSRERVFIVSIRKDIDTGKFEFPTGQRTMKVVAEFIDEDNENRYLKKSLQPYLDPKYHREYSSNSGVKKVFDGNVQGYFNSDYSGKRMYSIYGVCPTLTTKKGSSLFC